MCAKGWGAKSGGTKSGSYSCPADVNIKRVTLRVINKVCDFKVPRRKWKRQLGADSDARRTNATGRKHWGPDSEVERIEKV